jgi:hypothetical protein
MPAEYVFVRKLGVLMCSALKKSNPKENADAFRAIGVPSFFIFDFILLKLTAIVRWPLPVVRDLLRPPVPQDRHE